jgi:para-nitrobenzyl esterase
MHRKPFVFGMNHDEGVIFAALAESLLGGYALSVARYDSLVSHVFGPANHDAIVNYQASGGSYPYRPQGHAAAAALDSVGAAMAQLLNDFAFNCANLAAADSAYTLNGSNPIFGYRFEQPPFFNLYGGSTACTPANLYACHAYELPYVFRTFSFARTDNGGSQQPTTGDWAVSLAMSGAWTAFATNPASTAASWAQYVRTSPPTDTAPRLMVFSTSPSMQGGLALSSNCSMWKKMPPFGARQ